MKREFVDVEKLDKKLKTGVVTPLQLFFDGIFIHWEYLNVTNKVRAAVISEFSVSFFVILY